ncbi:MAG TPA: FAD-dependent oxidoreductase [Myxococcota bacterium]|nr:FAD-dependent oxidoreductase [Myxococcota bacterium]
MLRDVHLSPPSLHNTCRGQEIGCVRPMRVGGPRVEVEALEDQVVFHAYGFGGGGWTLAPGVAALGVAQFEAARGDVPGRRSRDVAVVGAGVIGLSLATALAARPDVDRVTVYSERFCDLASNHAGGLLAPVSLGIAVGEAPWLEAVAIDGYRRWSALARDHAHRPWQRRGARVMDTFEAPGGLEMDAYVKAGVMRAPEPVRVHFGADGPSYAMARYTTLFMNTGGMMAELRDEAETLGVTFEPERLRSFDALDEPFVFNCAGLGARELARDPAMVPVLGHLIGLQNQPHFVRQQYMTGATVDGTPCYHIPKVEPHLQGVLGGTFLEGVEDPRGVPDSFDGVWNRARTFFYGPARGRDWRLTAA